MSDDEEFLSEESYEFEFEDEDEADIQEDHNEHEDSMVCIVYLNQPMAFKQL